MILAKMDDHDLASIQVFPFTGSGECVAQSIYICSHSNKKSQVYIVFEIPKDCNR